MSIKNTLILSLLILLSSCATMRPIFIGCKPDDSKLEKTTGRRGR